jgi:cell division protein FtsL
MKTQTPPPDPESSPAPEKPAPDKHQQRKQCNKMTSQIKKTITNIQNVKVVNFPKKEKVITILSLIATIISLTLAFISTSLYIHEIKKCPDLYVNVSSPTRILGKAFFEFGDDPLSKSLDFYVRLQNKGNKKSESLTLFFLTFDKKVDVSLKSQDFWNETGLFAHYKQFAYCNENITINPDTSKHTGTYALRIPPMQVEPLLLAIFTIEGDFKRKEGLIYYDYLNEKYNVVHYTNPNRAIEIWNRRLNQ